MGLVVSFFLCGPLGALWMLYDCVRHRKTPSWYFVLAFVPYGFIFYYLERVRGRTRTVVSRTEQRKIRKGLIDVLTTPASRRPE